MSKFLIGLGLLLIIIGLFWPIIGKIPFGQLPGDFSWRGKNYSFYFPITSCLIVSALFSLVLWIISRLTK